MRKKDKILKNSKSCAHFEYKITLILRKWFDRLTILSLVERLISVKALVK